MWRNRVHGRFVANASTTPYAIGIGSPRGSCGGAVDAVTVDAVPPGDLDWGGFVVTAADLAILLGDWG